MSPRVSCSKGSGYQQCRACQDRWNYSWRDRCYRCSAPLAGLVPAAGHRPAPSGAWAHGRPRQAAAAKTQSQQPQDIPLSVLLHNTLASLAKAGIEPDDEVAIALKSKIAEEKQQREAGQEPWQRLRSLQDQQAKKEKQLEQSVAALEKLVEQQVEIEVKIAEAEKTIAAHKVALADLAAQALAAVPPKEEERPETATTTNIIDSVRRYVPPSCQIQAQPMLEALAASLAAVEKLVAEARKAEEEEKAKQQATAAEAVSQEGLIPATLATDGGPVVDAEMDFDEDSLKRVLGEAATPETVGKLIAMQASKRRKKEEEPPSLP